jgi:predicted DCC family thiol-disulfide oxidoreductase YuxK
VSPQQLNTLLKQRPLILFDGLCPFCHFSVRLLLRFDRKGVLQFAPLPQTGIIPGLPQNVDSVILCLAGNSGKPEFHVKSDVLIRLAPLLQFPVNLLRYLKWFPRSLRDGGYDLIARYRTRLFGRYETCPIPDQRYRDRFISLENTDSAGGRQE